MSTPASGPGTPSTDSLLETVNGDSQSTLENVVFSPPTSSPAKTPEISLETIPNRSTIEPRPIPAQVETEKPPWRPLRNFIKKQLNTSPPTVVKGDPQQQEKYLKEYENMVKNFQENEKRKKEAELRIREKREQKQAECSKIWKESDLIANWEQRKKLKKTHELVSHGIPPQFRTLVWPIMIGNRLGITEELFNIYVAQAKRVQQLAAGNEIGKEGSLGMIKLDLPRTFPALSFFQPQGPLNPQLLQVLEAYVSYRPDVGYVQGMSYLASVLLLVLDTYSAFQCFANLLNRPLFLGFFRMELEHINKFVDVVERLMVMCLPNLFEHLQGHNITTHVFVIDWVLTLFTKTLPLDVAFRVWDSFFLEGEIYIFKVGLALLSLSANELLCSPYENCMLILTHFPDPTEEELFAAVANININVKSDKIVEAYLKEITPQ